MQNLSQLTRNLQARRIRNLNILPLNLIRTLFGVGCHLMSCRTYPDNEYEGYDQMITNSALNPSSSLEAELVIDARSSGR